MSVYVYAYTMKYLNMIDAFLYVFSITNIFLFHCLSVYLSECKCVCLFVCNGDKVIYPFVSLFPLNIYVSFVHRQLSCTQMFCMCSPISVSVLLFIVQRTHREREGERLEGYFTHQRQNKSIKRKCKLHSEAHCTFHVLSYPYTPTSIPGRGDTSHVLQNI